MSLISVKGSPFTDAEETDLINMVAAGSVNGSGTLNQITYWVDSNTIGALSIVTYPSLTELSYVKGVTSSIQIQLNGKQASGSYITALTGDGTASGPGSTGLTLATVNSNVGTFGSATQSTQITVNGKGLITAVSNLSISLTSTAITDFTEAAQDAVGAMVDATLVYVDVTPLLTRGAITGDISVPQASNTSTLATVNSNVGTFGSATQSSQVTVNAKGLVTAVSNVTVTPAVGSITGLGTGVATALAVNVGSAGAFVTFNGALGTPSSGTGTNITGIPAANILAGTFGTGAYIMDTSLRVPLITGSNAANGDITINGTSSGTVTSSSVILQSAGGNVGIGVDPGSSSSLLLIGSTGEAQLTIASDINSVSADTDAYLRFTKNGIIGTLVGLMGYDEGLDRFVVGMNGSGQVRIDSTGNLYTVSGTNIKLAGTAVRATTEGTNHLDLFNGTAPVGTLTNGASLYCEGGEMKVMDAGGTATQISPHDKAGFWVFDSKNTVTGNHLKIDVERMLRFLNNKFGTDFIHEFID